MAFFDAHVGERGSDGVDGAPELGVGEVAAGGCVDEGDVAVVGLRGNECGDVERVVGWERDWFAFAVEGGVGFAEAASGIDGGRRRRWRH